MCPPSLRTHATIRDIIWDNPSWFPSEMRQTHEFAKSEAFWNEASGQVDEWKNRKAETNSQDTAGEISCIMLYVFVHLHGYTRGTCSWHLKAINPMKGGTTAWYHCTTASCSKTNPLQRWSLPMGPPYPCYPIARFLCRSPGWRRLTQHGRVKFTKGYLSAPSMLPPFSWNPKPKHGSARPVSLCGPFRVLLLVN